MTKLEFLKQLNSGISALPQNEINERLMFYSEMIDDLIEEGLSEEEAVSKIGRVDEIVSQITADLPISEAIKKKINLTRRLKAWEIALLILGSPLWASLLIAAFAIALSLYASVWAVIISLWSIFASVIGCALGGLASSIVFICSGSTLSGAAMLGLALVCTGFSILLFFGCREVSNGFVMLTKRVFKRKKGGSIMRKATKIWPICAVALILFGAMIFGGAMSMLNWNFLKLSTNKCETNEHEINEDFSNISIKTDTSDVLFLPSNDEKTHVICREYKNENHSVMVTDNTLTIELTDTRKWYEHISFISFDTPSIKVYLPKEEYDAIVINSSTGDVEIPDFLKLESIDVNLSTGHISLLASSEFAGLKTDTGKINVENVTVGTLGILVSTGDVTLKNTSCEGYISIGVTTGDVNVFDTRCNSFVSKGTTGDITLKSTIATSLFSIERNTGDVELEACDADEILIVTDTGHVHGALLSDKVFITSSDTGRIRVPESTTGGKCKITTDTGNIKISIAK